MPAPRRRSDSSAESGAPAGKFGTNAEQSASTDELSEHEIALASVAPPPQIDLDEWIFDEDIELVRRLAGKRKEHFGRLGPARLPDFLSVAHARPAPSIAQPGGKQRSSLLAWALLAIGLMAFVFGAVLLGWSLLADRQELWNLGLPIALAGQLPLLLGLVLLLDGLWQSDRRTADKLEQVDERLVGLDQTAAQASGHVPAPSFYSHLASGASPQMLLADLRSQLDLLAVTMSNRG